MRAIVTRQNNDGSYDEVGMNNRWISNIYCRESTLRSFALLNMTGTFRLELFNGSIQSDSVKTIFITK